MNYNQMRLRLFSGLILSLVSFVQSTNMNCLDVTQNRATNQCVTFSVSAGTGCQWMCQYCASYLGTNNYYFTDGVCTYQPGGCSGNPQVGVAYTCCSN